MGRSKSTSFRNMSRKPAQPPKAQPAQAQPAQAQPAQQKASSMMSGITTGLGMGLGMEAARAASGAMFDTEKQKIVNVHNCENLLKELEICLSVNDYLGACEGILDRYQRCLKNEY